MITRNQFPVHLTRFLAELTLMGEHVKRKQLLAPIRLITKQVDETISIATIKRLPNVAIARANIFDITVSQFY
jgi:hypothetical protein